MANLEQVRKELEILHDQARQGFEQLKSAYGQYLRTLAPLAEQQLITAAYQVCTQIVPERFLQLEFEQRERLQRKIHTLGGDLRLSLQELLADQSSARAVPPPAEIAPSTPTPPPNLDPGPEAAESVISPPTKLEKPGRPEVNLEMAMATLLHEAAFGVNRALQNVEILPEFPWEQILEIVLKAEGRPLGRWPNIMMVMVAGTRSGLEREREEQPEKAAPKKSNHNHPSLEPSQTEDLQPDEADTTPEPESDPESASEQDQRDLAAFFQALLKRQNQDSQSDPEAETELEELAAASEQDETQLTEVPPAEDRPIALIAIYLNLDDIEFHHPGLGGHRQQIRQIKAKLNQIHQKIEEKFRQRLTLEASRAWRETWPSNSET